MKPQTMNHARISRACKIAKELAELEALGKFPGHVLQTSSHYLVIEPFAPFGECLWDNSMAEVVRMQHRAQDKGATAFYIAGVVNVASERHCFTANQYHPAVASWRVDITF
jgi:hypothetical protein